MTTLIRVAVAIVVALAMASPAFARMAAIQTAVPLEDQSQSSIETAAKQAVETAVKGAVAMGLPQVQLRRAVVVQNMVVIQIVATDDAADREDQRPEGMRESGPTIEPDKTSVTYY
jgi:hypothetical protein